MNEQRYTIEVTESQLLLIANCVEDIHRYLSGETELHNSRVALDNYNELCEKLKVLEPFVTPDFYFNSYFVWLGFHYPKDAQRKMLAQTYAIYREIYHQLVINKHVPNSDYASETITCEDGGELPKIKKL